MEALSARLLWLIAKLATCQTIMIALQQGNDQT